LAPGPDGGMPDMGEDIGAPITLARPACWSTAVAWQTTDVKCQHLRTSFTYVIHITL